VDDAARQLLDYQSVRSRLANEHIELDRQVEDAEAQVMTMVMMFTVSQSTIKSMHIQ